MHAGNTESLWIEDALAAEIAFTTVRMACVFPTPGGPDSKNARGTLPKIGSFSEDDEHDRFCMQLIQCIVSNKIRTAGDLYKFVLVLLGESDGNDGVIDVGFDLVSALVMIG